MNRNPFAVSAPGIGPGSQPAMADGAELQVFGMPQGMRAYVPPSLPEPEDVAVCRAGIRLLRQLLHDLKAVSSLARPAPVQALDLLGLPEPDHRLVMEALGEGEVSVCIGLEPVQRIQETRLAGIWRTQCHDAAGRCLRDDIVVADLPGQVRCFAFQDAVSQANNDKVIPSGVMSGRTLVSELNQRVAKWRPGDQPYVINLDLLPHTREDLIYLTRVLGQGPVEILSRGYGSCRILASRLTNCWWVQHFNSEDKLILNTIEVVDIPHESLAAQEDIEDSAQRLTDILDALLN